MLILMYLLFGSVEIFKKNMCGGLFLDAFDFEEIETWNIACFLETFLLSDFFFHLGVKKRINMDIFC